MNTFGFPVLDREPLLISNKLKVERTSIPGVLVFEPVVYEDPRGFFFESFNQSTMAEVGLVHRFVQDNHSRSRRNVVRGLHYQVHQPQGKLVRVVSGDVFDVAVDIRRSSRTFGKWIGIYLSDENKRLLWLPPGMAHGFVVMSQSADFLYKTTDFYAPQHERTILWNDEDIGIQWPLSGEAIVSDKDQLGLPLRNSETFD